MFRKVSMSQPLALVVVLVVLVSVHNIAVQREDDQFPLRESHALSVVQRVYKPGHLQVNLLEDIEPILVPLEEVDELVVPDHSADLWDQSWQRDVVDVREGLHAVSYRSECCKYWGYSAGDCRSVCGYSLAGSVR